MSGSPIGVGDRIADKYTVESIIGEGGMGLVVAARHVELDQRVAIKLLLPVIAQQGTAAERFRREARSAARIRSDHVCRVLDVGTLPTGVPYLVMEFLEGGDLATELERRTRLPVLEAIEYVLQACEGLAEAHAVGIVHRDLKPANLYLAKRSDGSRRVKLLDFGVSKALDDSGADLHKLTQTSTLVGSPLYMSPEQLSSSRDVDVRTDIWALGAVLYELLIGKPPFTGGNIPQLVHSVVNEPHPSAEQQDHSLPRGIDAVITRALAKKRDERYPSIAEFASDLAPFAPRHALISVSRVSRLLSSQARGVPTGTEDTAIEGRSSRSSNGQGTPMAWSGAKKQEAVKDAGSGKRVGLVVAAIIVLLGLGIAIALGVRGGGPEEELPIAKPAAPSDVVRSAAAPAPVAPPPAPREEPAPPVEQAEAAPAAVAPAAPAPAAESAVSGERPRPRRERAVSTREAATEPAAPPQAASPAAPAPKPSSGISDFGGRR
jgi:serine/threonine protein kinase